MTMPGIIRFIGRRGYFTPLLLSLVLCGSISAQTDSQKETAVKPPQFTEEKISLIEENLVRDLESPIVGVTIGGAQAVREMKKAARQMDFERAARLRDRIKSLTSE